MRPISVIFCILFLGWHAVGQTKLPNAEAIRQEKEKEKESEQKKQETLLEAQGAVTLETAIDPELYNVGPDDQFLISIWGQINESFPALITPEGMIAIPSVKTIDVRDMKLGEAKLKIIAEMKKVYPNADISVNLLRLRSFKVLMTGLAVTPGTYKASGADRVSALVQRAGGVVVGQGSLRNIKIKQRSGAIIRADLILRDRSGSVEWDPLVSAGDVVHIPAVYSNIYLFGSVSQPGMYEFVEGERLSDMVRLGGGLAYGADSTIVEVVRMKSDSGRATQMFALDLDAVFKKPQDTLHNIRILPDDRIFFKVKPRFHEKAEVVIRGEVLIPGTFSIVEGETKITDIVSRAGGFTPNVSLDRIVIYRNPVYEGKDQEFERLKLTPISDMNDIEKSYFKARIKQADPTVQTDFKKLYPGAGAVNRDYDVLLRRGDIIDVAPLKKTVTVVGGAVLSGIVDWVPGKAFRYYVEKSGGYTAKAKRGDVRIIKASTQKWLDADDDVTIDDGDIVFIPEKEPVKGWEIFKDALSITGQMAAITSTIILIFFTINRN